VSESFIIFKDPLESAPVGWLGTWHPVAQPSASETAFFIQPWLENAPVEALLPEKMLNTESDIERLLQQASPATIQGAATTEKAFFTHLVAFIRTGIIQGDFEKVVAARQAVAPLTRGIYDIFQLAVASYPNCFVYCMQHPTWGLWIGASPEKFVHYEQGEANTVALAGSLFHKDATWTGKEQEEQSVTAGYIRSCAAALGLELSSTSVEEKLQGNLRHLSESICMVCPPEKLPLLMHSMHPTPAVGGFPKVKALHFIERFEQLDRKLYSGWLGYATAGKLHTWVNLRCANLGSKEAVLYAGCGVNAGSDPEVEWQETEAKLQIMKAII
jgi:isochorismate synthase